jgi:CBS domain-containing protein
MLARQVMTSPVITALPETPVSEIARRMSVNRISGLPVIVPGGKIVGMVSEGDLLRREEIETERDRSWWLDLFQEPVERAAAYVKTHGRTAADVMTRKVISVSPTATIGEIAERLEEARIKRVPVIEDGVLVGIVSRANIVRALASKKEAIVGVAPTDISLRRRILDVLAKERLLEHDVNPIVNDGVVHLWGLVPSAEERDAIRVATGTVPGVRSVTNHLGVKPHSVRLLG